MKPYLLILQTALVLSALATRGQGTFTYDQQSATNRSISGGGLPFQAEQPAGQSFTPTLSSVGFVQFQFIDPHPGDGVGATVYVNLWADSLGGTFLGSTAPVSMPDGFFFGVTNFLFGTSVAVTPGIVYYLQPVLQSGDPLWEANGGPYSYSGGTSFFNGSPDPNGYNLWFREGVRTPEPSPGLLVLLGIAGMWCARRLKRSHLLLVLAAMGALGVGTAGAYTTRTTVAANYFSAQHPEWPPMPAPTPDCAVTQIPGLPGCWLIQDQDYDYAAVQMALSMATPMGIRPDTPSPIDHGTGLWLEIAQPVSGDVPVTAHNVDVLKWFQLLSATNLLAHPDWTVRAADSATCRHRPAAHCFGEWAPKGVLSGCAVGHAHFDHQCRRRA
jgi:hypothetical protein